MPDIPVCFNPEMSKAVKVNQRTQLWVKQDVVEVVPEAQVGDEELEQLVEAAR